MDVFAFNKNVHKYWIRSWAWNAFVNHPKIKEEYEADNRYFEPLPNVNGQLPALIIGSGPSLNDAMPLLSQWMGGIFCSPSHVRILDQWNRHPEWILALDGSDSQFDKLQGPIYNKSTLITHPSVSKKIIDWWTWEKRYFLTHENNDEWAGTILPAAYPWISSKVVNAGCSANVQVLLAYMMGYSPIITVGVDFGHPNNEEKCLDYEYRGPYVYLPKSSKIIDPEVEDPAAKWMYENGVLTTSTNMFYKTIALGNWYGYKYKIYDASAGIISEMPKVNFKDLIEGQEVKNGVLKLRNLPKYPAPKEIEKMAWEYLEPLGVLPMIKDGEMLGIEFAANMESGEKEAQARLDAFAEKRKMWEEKDGKWRLTPREAGKPTNEPKTPN